MIVTSSKLSLRTKVYFLWFDYTCKLEYYMVCIGQSCSAFCNIVLSWTGHLFAVLVKYLLYWSDICCTVPIFALKFYCVMCFVVWVLFCYAASLWWALLYDWYNAFLIFIFCSAFSKTLSTVLAMVCLVCYDSIEVLFSFLFFLIETIVNLSVSVLGNLGKS